MVILRNVSWSRKYCSGVCTYQCQQEHLKDWGLLASWIMHGVVQILFTLITVLCE